LTALAVIVIAPRIPNGDLYTVNRPQALTFKDEKGAIIGVRGAIFGDRLKLTEMPGYLPAAFLAVEDRKFYSHHGFDPTSVFRAAMADLRALHIVQGGSTITQQVVKIVLLSPDRTFWRKLREIAGALVLERHLSKDEILQLYLNRLYLGSGTYGVDGAAHAYFGKSARKLTLAEAAMVAGLTSAPSIYSPRRDLGVAQSRAGQVLSAMVKTRVITEQEAAQARAHPAKVVNSGPHRGNGYFLDAAAHELWQVMPAARGDLIITTTIDPDLQEAARAQISSDLNRRAARIGHATQGALVAMTPDGAIRTLIGGRAYGENRKLGQSVFNRVTDAHRQPGSAFKPFVYLAALEQGLTPSTVRVDAPVAVRKWKPENYTGDHVGPVALHVAFARSINTVAVDLGQEVGLARVVSVAHRLGIGSRLRPVPSLALGTSEVSPLELTAAYATFSTLGYRVQPYMVTLVQSPNGAILYRRKPPQPARVMDEKHALMMNGMMQEVVQTGTGRAAAVPGHEVAGKTGTSANYRDAWFVGFAPQLITGVWVGNDDFSPMKKVTGGTLPAQIWGGFMRSALKNAPVAPLLRSGMLDYSNRDCGWSPT
jgi:penicillin-binding protein 1A